MTMVNRRFALVAVGLLLTFAALASAQKIAPEYINPPELCPLPYSYGVTFPAEMKTIEVKSTASGSKWNATGIASSVPAASDLKGQMSQALNNLQAALKEIGATTDDVARLNVKFVGDSLDETILLSDLIEKAMQSRTTHAGRMPQPPVRSMVGVRALDQSDKLVEVQATVFDPATHSFKSNKAKLNSGELASTYGLNRTLLIGGVTAMQHDFSVKGMGSIRLQMRAALANLDTVLKYSGGNRTNLDKVTVYFVPNSNDRADIVSAEEVVKAEAKKYFGEQQLQLVAQDATVDCAASLKVLIDAGGKVQLKEEQPEQKATAASR